MALRLIAFAALAFPFYIATSASAQTSFPVCDTQQQLEQVVQSDGELMPEGCWTATVTTIKVPAGLLCVVKLGSEDGGIIGALRETVATTEWWTECGNLNTD